MTRTRVLTLIGFLIVGVAAGLILRQAFLDPEGPARGVGAPRATEAPPAGVSNAAAVSSDTTSPNPFFNGVRYEGLSEAEQAAGVAIIRPHDDPLASDDQIQEIWVDVSTKTPQVRVYYVSGVSSQMMDVVPEALRNEASARELFEEMAQDAALSTNGEAKVVTLADGSPAFLMPDGAAVFANGESQGAPGGIDMMAGGWMLEVVGHVTNEDLIRLASSVTAGA